MFSNPTVADFKNYFVRDFPYGTDINTTILDADIARALADSDILVNQGLFKDQTQYTTGFLLLTAHNLVMNIKASSQGISGQFDWLLNSKAVGSVSEGIAIPQRILDNPELALLSKTPYGAKYLFLILPQLTGQIFSAHGRTQA